MTIWKRAREAKPTRLLGRMRLELELVEVVRYGYAKGALGPIIGGAHERRE